MRNATVVIIVAALWNVGCGAQVRVEDPIAFEGRPIEGARANLGLIIPEATRNYTLENGGCTLMLGEAVAKNIAPSLSGVFQSVTFCEAGAVPSPCADRVAIVRFGNASYFHMPATVFQEIEISVVLDVEVLDRSQHKLWSIAATGKRAGHQPPNMLILVGAIKAFYRDLTREAVKAALDDLRSQMSAQASKQLTLGS